MNIRYMKSTRREHDDNTVEEEFKVGLVDSYFADNALINRVWRRAKIRLFVNRIDRCRYDPREFQVFADEEGVASPLAGHSGRENFQKVSALYRHDAVKGLDLFVWWHIRDFGGGEKTIGYGEPHVLSDGSAGGGAVWLDRECPTVLTGHRCEQLIAHEIGHYLGLCHTCERAGADQGACFNACAPPPGQRPVCEVPALDLMGAAFDGDSLSDCEAARAHDRARRRVQGNP